MNTVLYLSDGCNDSNKGNGMNKSVRWRADRDAFTTQTKAQLLLDGLIAYRRELGDVGRQLEYLLRQRGVRASIDPAFSTRYH